jgi:Zn-dependent protease
MIIFTIAILIVSVIIHEISHGATANMLGDPTAKYSGRLTLNPLKHLDPVGSFIVPLFLVMFYQLTGGMGFIFGWAKPVPYNPYNLKNQRWGPAIVGLAGPLSNLFIALVFGLAMRFIAFGESSVWMNLYQIFSMIVWINILLGIFNLMPIPPLDGSKILFAALPYSMNNVRNFLTRYWMFVLIFLLFFGLNWVFRFVFLAYFLLVGSIPLF